MNCLHGSPTELAAIARPPNTEVAFLIKIIFNKIIAVAFILTVRNRSTPFQNKTSTQNQQDMGISPICSPHILNRLGGPQSMAYHNDQ